MSFVGALFMVKCTSTSACCKDVSPSCTLF